MVIMRRAPAISASWKMIPLSLVAPRTRDRAGLWRQGPVRHLMLNELDLNVLRSPGRHSSVVRQQGASSEECTVRPPGCDPMDELISPGSTDLLLVSPRRLAQREVLAAMGITHLGPKPVDERAAAEGCAHDLRPGAMAWG